MQQASEMSFGFISLLIHTFRIFQGLICGGRTCTVQTIMLASEEVARKYYSTKQFLFTGVQNVFFPLLPRPDTKFFDPQNIWPIYSNQPLKDSLERFAKFPIATSLN